MTNPDSNLPPEEQSDFFSVPTDAELERNFELPDNTYLPYADEVTDDKLWSVTARTFKNNPLTWEFPDVFSFYDEADERISRDLIYQAYERVTGHDSLDPAEQLNRLGEGSWGGDNNFIYNVYGNALHNGLVKYRQSDLLTGASLYHLTRRLITYLQDLEPTSYLGSIDEGRWWLAPDCYHILVSCGRIEQGPDDPPPSYGASTIGAAHMSTDYVAQSLYGTDRFLDGERFDRARFTFHWINLQFYNYPDPKKTAEKDAEKEDHWALVIRHAGTNRGHYFDSMFSHHSAGERATRLRLVREAMNRWLGDSGKPLLVDLKAPARQPVQRELKNKGLWQCGVHTMANAIAFIRCGRLGWHNIPAWRGATASTGREADMVDQIGRSLHRLMGLTHDPTEDKSRSFSAKGKKMAWTKPATKSGKADLAKIKAQTVTSAGSAAATAKAEKEAKEKETELEAEEDLDPEWEQEQTNEEVKKINSELSQLRTTVASMKTELLAAVRSELVAVVRAELGAILGQGQGQPATNTTTTTTTREQALNEREQNLNAREQALAQRENQLKRKLDESEEDQEISDPKRQKTDQQDVSK